jgi:hypothetical protein
VLRNVRGGNGYDSSPAVAQNECRYGSRKGDRRAQNCVRDGGEERRARLIRVLVLSGCAATVCLRLADNACRCGSLRVSAVHRTLAVSAACHARFGRRCPTGADRCITDRNQTDQGEGEQAPAECHYMSRMPKWATRVKPASLELIGAVADQDSNMADRKPMIVVPILYERFDRPAAPGRLPLNVVSVVRDRS